MMNRRDVLQGLSLSMLSSKLLWSSPLRAQTADPQPRTIAANDRINVGVIGVGSRGRELTRQLLRVPGVEIVAVCDLYEPQFGMLNKLVGKTVPSYKDYRELLKRKDLDAIFIGTSPVAHGEIAVAALESGRPVYGEKTLGFTVEDCNNIVAATRRTGQIFQIGHQFRYGSWFQEAVKRVHKGDIGVPTHVYSYYHRNDDWRRAVPDPKFEHLLNWRLYTETSGGLLEELGSHAIDIANWVFDDQPETVMGSSSITTYHDGRTVGDNVQAIMGYTKGRRMFFSSVTDNAIVGDQMWVYGTEGSVQITMQDATFYKPTSKKISAASHSEVIDRGLKTGASYSTSMDMPYRGPGDKIPVDAEENPAYTACKDFIECVREKRKPFADVEVGYRSAIACAVGREALKEGRTMNLPRLEKS